MDQVIFGTSVPRIPEEISFEDQIFNYPDTIIKVFAIFLKILYTRFKDIIIHFITISQ